MKQLGVLILPLFRRQVYGWLYFAKFPSNFLKNLTREMHCENRVLWETYHMILPFHSHRNPIHKRQWITLSISFGRCCCHLIKFKWKKVSNTMICSELQNNLVWDTTFKISSLSCWTMALNLGFCFSVSLMISITLSAICIGVTVCDLWQENKFNCKCKWEFVPYVVVLKWCYKI